MSHSHWIVKLPDLPEVDTDDLTLDDAEKFEKASGTPWTDVNPAKRARDAAALSLVVALRAGKTETEAADYVQGLTFARLRGAFTYDLVIDGLDSNGERLPPTLAPSSTAG